ncbi:MAG: hypothetical protein HQM16_13470 [Deltaproteobacteria bacterium]|nr:hypothetical protein [Deltaproteobacteria bacterium]
MIKNTGVLRGGAWYNNDHNSRASYRNNNHPDNRYNNNGVRLVVPSTFFKPVP